MDWLFGGFMLAPFCLVSTCGIPLLILTVVLIIRCSKTSSKTDSRDDEWERLTQSQRDRLGLQLLRMEDPEGYGTHSERQWAREERQREEEERRLKDGR
jgi:hypothetical protein